MRDATVKSALAGVFEDFFRWAAGQEIHVQEYRNEIALFLRERLERHGLIERQSALMRSGRIRLETLLFTAFGLPHHIDLV